METARFILAFRRNKIFFVLLDQDLCNFSYSLNFFSRNNSFWGKRITLFKNNYYFSLCFVYFTCPKTKLEQVIKNIINQSDRSKIINRVQSLHPEKSIRGWGIMTLNQMICHCTDQIKMAEGKIEINFIGNYFLTKIMKNIILLGVPAPKGKVKTYRELDQLKNGTMPTTFESDRSLLINTIKNFDEEYPTNNAVVHPSFGKMDKAQWGRLIYVHLKHHLKQFGS